MADVEDPYWQELEELFQTASDLGPDARKQLLDEYRTRRPELVAEVESLLASSEAAGDHLEQAIGDGFRLAAQDAARGEPERQRIGVYRVLGELGRGGLSVVYLAERDDDAYRKEVAIKLVKRGMDTREILLRLHQERQILANLDHPHIARLLDGGSTEDGLPYFVMERIHGEPIDEYCDRRGLGIRQRLELFRKACSAVQFAHQNLVVHRDIKPGNLLVTEDGTPKLLDFGIAKLLDPEHPGAAFTATAAGLRLLTPSFASPEQIQGRQLTTSTDVYSLGVLLYLLLTGQPPYRFATRGLTEIERVICDEIPERPSSVVRHTSNLDPQTLEEASAPSRRVSSARLARSLRGDLDKIVLMALRKEPQRRYASVEQLSADIGRYLGNLPVRARPDTFTYRTQKFARRHRIGLAAGFLVLASLLAGLAATLWQARRAQHNFERAEIERAKGERVSEFLIDLFKVSSPDRALGETITAREILDRGAERIRQDLQQDPEQRGALMDVIGTVYRNLGLYDQAEPLLLEALELNQTAYGDDHPAVAEGWSHLGSLRRTQGRLEEAEDLFRRSLELNRRLYGEPDPRVAEALNDLAAARFNRNDPDEAEALFRQALEMRLQIQPPDYEDLAEAQNNLAVVLYQRGELEAAEDLFRQALEARRNHFGEVHPLIANSLNNLASLFNRQNRTEEAEQILQEVVAMQEKLLGEEHPGLAPSLNNLAASQLARGSVEEAEQNYRRALKITRQAQGEENNEVATFQINLANLLVERGETAEASRLYLAAIRARETAFGPSHSWLVNPLLRLGRTLLETEAPGKAEPWLRRAIDILSAEEEPREPMLAEARCLLGADLLALGQERRAAAEIRACIPALAADRIESDPLLRASRQRLRQLETLLPPP